MKKSSLDHVGHVVSTVTFILGCAASIMADNSESIFSISILYYVHVHASEQGLMYYSNVPFFWHACQQ